MDCTFLVIKRCSAFCLRGLFVFLALETVVAVLLLTFLSSLVTFLLVSKSCLYMGKVSTFPLIAIANGFL